MNNKKILKIIRLVFFLVLIVLSSCLILQDINAPKYGYLVYLFILMITGIVGIFFEIYKNHK